MTDRGATLAELLQDPMRARLVPRGEAVALLVELSRVMKALELLSVETPPREDPGVPLTVEQVMELTGLGRRAVFARSLSQWRPYAIREGRKTLRFKPGFRKFYAERKA